MEAAVTGTSSCHEGWSGQKVVEAGGSGLQNTPIDRSRQALQLYSEVEVNR